MFFRNSDTNFFGKEIETNHIFQNTSKNLFSKIQSFQRFFWIEEFLLFQKKSTKGHLSETRRNQTFEKLEKVSKKLNYK